MGVKLQSALGGSVELNAPATASNFTMTVPAGNGTVATTDQLMGFRNRIINGDMRIAQRATTFTSPIDGTYTVDRWISGNANDGTVTVTQSSDAPTGFANSLRMTVTSADTSLAAGQYGGINARLEGYSIADMIDDTFTFSFWVRSSLTGKHCLSLRNSIAGLPTHSYIAPYTINTANTWEYKTITVVGGLPDGVATDKTIAPGLNIWFNTGSGSTYTTSTENAWVAGNFIASTGQVNLHATVGNIFAITGVQLEKGSVATTFEHRPIATELILCQRYFIKVQGNYPGQAYNGVEAGIMFPLPVVMRTSQSFTLQANGSLVTAAGGTVAVTGISAVVSDTGSPRVNFYVASGLVGGNATFMVGQTLWINAEV